MSTTAPPRLPGHRDRDHRSNYTSTRGPERTHRSSSFRLGNTRKRGVFLLIITLIALGVFAAKLVQVQGFQGEALAAAAVDQRLRTVDIPANRGEITDINGVPLAVTVEARNVTTDQTLVKDPAAAAAALAPVLNMDEADLQARLTGTRRFAYIAKGITPELWRTVDALHVPGIFSERTSKRVYPANDIGSSVIGFVGADGKGLGGLEYSLDSRLAGVAGSVTYERGAEGSAIPSGETDRTEPVPGSQVTLTLNRDIQFITQQALAEEVAAAQAESGTAVVMTKDGRILALASVPTFDANNPGAADAANRGNRALSDVFEPGSTAKVMTMAAVLNEGGATPTTPFVVPDVIHAGGRDFHDHNEHEVQDLTLTGILAKSSNVGTIMASQSISKETFYNYLTGFGIGQKTGLGFPGESAGILPKIEDWSITSFPAIAYGQGLAVTAVQAASVYATIANDGVRVTPTLIDHYTDADGAITTPVVGSSQRVISSETASNLRQMLEAVVSDEGTGSMAGIPGYRVGGKTGTAQIPDPSCGCYLAEGDVMSSFIGMAPVDDPQIVIGVSIAKPQVGRWGGELAGPVFKRVMTYALQTLQIPPTGTKPESLPIFVPKNG